MKCEELREHLTAFLLGDLDEATRSAVEKHLEQCEGCRAERRELELTLDLVRDALSASSSETTPQRLTPDRRARIVSESPVRRPVRVLQWFSTAHPRFTLAAAACLVIAFIIVGMMMPASQKARSVADYKVAKGTGVALEPRPLKMQKFAGVPPPSASAPEQRPLTVNQTIAPSADLDGDGLSDVSKYKSFTVTISGSTVAKELDDKSDSTGVESRNREGESRPGKLGMGGGRSGGRMGKGTPSDDSVSDGSAGTDWKFAERPTPPATAMPPRAPAPAPGAVVSGPQAERALAPIARTDYVDARKAPADLKETADDLNLAAEEATVKRVKSPEGTAVRGSVMQKSRSSVSSKPAAAAPARPESEERAAGNAALAKDVDPERARRAESEIVGRAKLRMGDHAEVSDGLEAVDQPAPIVMKAVSEQANAPVQNVRARNSEIEDRSQKVADLETEVKDKTTLNYTTTGAGEYYSRQKAKSEVAGGVADMAKVADPKAEAWRREGRFNDVVQRDDAANKKESVVGSDGLRRTRDDSWALSEKKEEDNLSGKRDADRSKMVSTVAKPTEVTPSADAPASVFWTANGKFGDDAQSGGKSAGAPTPSKAPERKMAQATNALFGPTLSASMIFKTEEPRNLPAKFRAFGVNPFVETASQPFSTFSIDVDTASYTISRNYMLRGQRPPAEAVRTEDFVNFFDYAYAAPTRETFRVYADVAPSKFGSGLQLVKIGVKGKRLGREEQRGAVLTFLVDTSGSMDKPDRIGLVRKSLKMLLGKLNPQDQVAIVQFDSNVRLVLDHTPASEKEKISGVLDALQCSGSTHLEGGMLQAYEVAARSFNPKAENRVLILSDGVANLGTMAAEDILAKVEAYRKQGIYCSVFGFGIGTFDDTMLQTLANKGNGAYAFIDSEVEAKRVFVDDLAATLNTIAADVKIQVEFNPKRVAKYRQIGYEKRQLKKEDFRNDSVDAGEVGSGQSVTALYEVELKDGRDALATVRLRYRRTDNNRVEEVERAVTAADLKQDFEKADARFRLAACAAEFSELLRGSPHAAGNDFADVANALRPVALELPLDSQVQELLRLVQSAGSLSLATP